MTTRGSLVATAALLVWMAGCGEAPALPEPADTSHPADAGPDVADPPDVPPAEDLVPDPGAPDSGPPLPDPGPPAPDTKPDVAPTPPATLCDPCHTDEDCGAGSVCAPLGNEGTFCAGPCEACPAGYTCTEVGCVPESGICPCSEAAIAAALTTPCEREGEHGTCAGVRTCGPAGLSACDAPLAAPEVCGGGDENCDGAVDEAGAAGCTVLFSDADEDGFGDAADTRCLCAPAAPWTVIKAGDCDDADPSVLPGQPEVCNGVDDDCDGVTDPGDAPGCVPWYFDGDGDGWGVAALSVCACGPTGDYAAPESGDCNDQDPGVHPDQPCGPPVCSFFVLSGGCPPGPCGQPASSAPCPAGLACLDGSTCRSACVTGAHCQPGHFCDGGACVEKAPAGQPCTQDSACASGHCGGGFCCTAGACCNGEATACDDGNPCTDDTCGGDFTCQHAPATGACSAAACDGLTFTGAGQCEDGECVALTTACGGDNPCKSYGCNPQGGCTAVNLPLTTACGDLTCQGFELTQPRWCNGLGACSEGGEQSACPGGFACNAQQNGCRTSCSTDSHCQPDTYCQGGQCVEKKGSGDACAADHQCASGTCTGGQCCAGCCDTGANGVTGLPRAMEICGETGFQFQGSPQCAAIRFQFGAFTHLDHAPALDDTVMVQLSTGVAASSNNQQPGENMGTSGPDPDGTANIAYDLCGFTVTLKVPDDAKGFAFDFIFFSAEYPEWIDSPYNDTFNAMLSGGGYQNENTAFDAAGNPISINVAFFTICNGDGCTQSDEALVGTGYAQGVGGATGWLTTTVPVKSGATITLRLVIYDETDHIFDSDVLLNNFRWLQVVSGTGPVTE